MLRAAVVAGVVGAALVAPRITIHALPAPPVASSLALSFQDTGTETWETSPIEATATIAGLSWEGDAPSRAWVRASEDGSEWSPWTELAVDAEHGPDPGTAEAAGSRPASEPVYVGRANWLQYRVEGAEPGRIKAEVVETAGRQLGALERAALVVRGIRLTESDQAGASPTAPNFISREEWGADSCQPSDPSPPEYITRVRVMFVHHTATANGYTEAEAPEVIRSVCAYHVFTLGWSDIAYNFLIDRFGNTYEGRGGGVTQADLRRSHQGLQLVFEWGGADRRAHLDRTQPGGARVARAPPCLEARSQPCQAHRVVHGHVARLGDLSLWRHGDAPQHRRAPRCTGDELPGRLLLRPASIHPPGRRQPW